MSVPKRRPTLMLKRQQVIAERQAAEHAQAAAQRATEREAAEKIAAKERRRRANHPVRRALAEAGGWVLSITGALIVSVVLTYLWNDPKARDAIMAAIHHLLHI